MNKFKGRRKSLWSLQKSKFKLRILNFSVEMLHNVRRNRNKQLRKVKEESSNISDKDQILQES